MTAGAQHEAGVERIRIIDQAGGVGGTWNRNRHPGVMCDVESYIYLPMLEELGYDRASATHSAKKSGSTSKRSPSTRTHRRCLFHTGVSRAEWHEDESAGGSTPTGVMSSVANGTSSPRAS